MPDPVRRLPVRPLAGLEGQGCGALGSGVPAVRLPHSFPVRSSSIRGSHLPAFIPPLVHQRTKGVALREVTQALVAKSAVELAPLPSLGFAAGCS